MRRLLAVLLISVSISAPLAAESELSVAYVGDLFANVDGGIQTGEAWLQNVDLTYEHSFSDWFDGRGATFFGYVLYNDDTTFSDRYSGDAQVVSNIDTDEALRLYEFWLNMPVSENVEVLFGLFDLNSEFDAIDTAGLFLNSSHGIGADYSQSGENGPSIFPSTSLTLRIFWEIDDSKSLRYAILDGIPNDPNDSNATKIDLGGNDGVLHAIEYNQMFGEDLRWGLGAWKYSADFERLDGGTDDNNQGVYTFIDTTLAQGMTGFIRYGIATDDINPLSSYVGAGIAKTGLLSSRPDDTFGLAVSRINTGSPLKNLQSGIASDETIIDMTYSAQLTDQLRVQPNLQYVMNPGLDPSLDDALVIGIRFEAAWSAN